MIQRLNIAMFGSSLVSAYWNGAATYYRGIVRALSERGHRVTFYEPDVYERQTHRDMDDPPWAKVVVYQPNSAELSRALECASQTDLLIKTSGVGIFDDVLEAAILQVKSSHTIAVFWDVDAPATLDRLHHDGSDSFLPLIPQFDLILTYGGGAPVVDAYSRLGARCCTPIYNALDPSTHYPVQSDERYRADISLLANRLPDREGRIDEFFLKAAGKQPEKSFLLGGNGWQDKRVPANVKVVGHVPTQDHNIFNSSSEIVLNVSRESMARYGYSPATRIFEAAGAAACLITDAWQGIEIFLEPGQEILIAKSGQEVANYLGELTKDRIQQIGRAAYKRVLAEHTYEKRVDELERILDVKMNSSRKPAYVAHAVPAGEP